MSIWTGAADILVGAFSGGKGIIRDRTDPTAAGVSVRVVRQPSREDVDLGIAVSDVIVQLSGAEAPAMNGAKTLELSGIQYDFDPVQGVGPTELTAENAPIVVGRLSRKGR